MRGFSGSGVLAIGFLVLLGSSAALAWEIPGLDLQMVVEPDGRLRVIETVHVNFGTEAQRGLDVAIPTRIEHPVQGTLELDVNVSGVTIGSAGPVDYEVIPHDRFLQVKIGDPNTTRTGETVYRLRYEVGGAVVFGMNRATLEWPVADGEWDAPILEAQAVIELPEEMAATEVLARSHTGFFGERLRAADVQMADTRNIVYRVVRGLRPYERFTIAASWSHGGAPPERLVRRGPAGSLDRPEVLALIAVAVTIGLFVIGRRRARVS